MVIVRTGSGKAYPTSLEVFEVFYDDTDDTPFLWEDLECDSFVLDLINHKRAHLPYLHPVTIHSTEKLHDSETGEGLPMGLLTVPPLAREAESAGIELKMWLGYQDANLEKTDVSKSLKLS